MAKFASKAPTIVEGKSCKRQPKSGTKGCMKDGDCRKTCVDTEKATRATCDYTFPRHGIAFYISDNKVILTEGVDGVVPVDYFQKIEPWPSRQPIPF
ncbi:hypothetical protein Bca4012_035214 [Brassica carinata]